VIVVGEPEYCGAGVGIGDGGSDTSYGGGTGVGGGREGRSSGRLGEPEGRGSVSLHPDPPFPITEHPFPDVLVGGRFCPGYVDPDPGSFVHGAVQRVHGVLGVLPAFEVHERVVL